MLESIATLEVRDGTLQRLPPIGRRGIRARIGTSPVEAGALFATTWVAAPQGVEGAEPRGSRQSRWARVV